MEMDIVERYAVFHVHDPMAMRYFPTAIIAISPAILCAPGERAG